MDIILFSGALLIFAGLMFGIIRPIHRDKIKVRHTDKMIRGR